MRLEGVSEGAVGEDTVLIATADALAFDEAARFKILDDPLDGSFGNTDGQCDFAEHHLRVIVQHDQNVSVVGEEGPAVGGGVCRVGFFSWGREAVCGTLGDRAF